MLNYRKMTAEDEEIALQMMGEFYRTDAVCTPPPNDHVARNVAAMLDEENPAVWGILVLDGSQPAGYFMLTSFYSGEVAGSCIMIEQLYVSSACRGQGVGRQMMDWLRENYPQASRFQLEVNEKNPAAVRLYEGRGFCKNSYDTMYINISTQGENHNG